MGSLVSLDALMQELQNKEVPWIALDFGLMKQQTLSMPTTTTK
jgi:hypothetical protein